MSLARSKPVATHRDCAKLALRSKRTTMTTANVTVAKKTLANISVVWVNMHSLEEVLLPVVEAGKSYVISSSTGHELRAREVVSHRLLRSFKVTAEPAQLMSIDYPSAVKEEAKAAAVPKQEESDDSRSRSRGGRSRTRRASHRPRCLPSISPATRCRAALTQPTSPRRRRLRRRLHHIARIR